MKSGSTLARPLACGVVLLATLLLHTVASAQERARVEVVPQVPHAGRVMAAAFTPGGERVLTGSKDGTLKLWDIATARLVRTFVGHMGDVTEVALSRDGSRALSGGEDKTIRLWEVATGRLIRTIDAHPGSHTNVNSVAFSPDGRRLLSSSYGDVSAKLWDAGTGRLVRTFRHAKGPLRSGIFAGLTSAVFSSDGTRVATAGLGDKIVNVWDAETGHLLQSFWDPDSDRPYHVRLAFSPDGTRLLAGDSSSLRIWDAAKGTPLHTLATPGSTSSSTPFVGFSPDGAHALTSAEWKVLDIWSVETGQGVRTFAPKSGPLVAMSPDGSRLLSGTWNDFELWDVATGQSTHSTFEGRSLLVSSVAASPEGSRLLTVDRKVRLWDAAAGRLERSLDEPWPGAIAFSPDGSRLVSGIYNGLNVFDVASGQRVRSVRTFQPRRVTFSPDGTRMISITDGGLLVWDAAGGQPIQSFGVPVEGLPNPPAAFSPDAARLLTAFDRQPAKVWDVASGQAVYTFAERSPRNPLSAALSPDKTHAVIGYLDGTLRFWELATGNPVRSLWHSRPVNALAFSRDGSRLLSGGDDTTIKLWDTATGQAIRTFAGHSASVRSVAFTPDEQRVISGSHDRTVRIWDVATGDQLAMLLTTRNDEWLVITPEGFFEASPRGAEMLTVVRGLEVFGIDQFYQALYRPDLVREKLAGDPDGKVKAAAARLDLGKLVDSGRVPSVTIVSHKAQDTTPNDLVIVEAVVAGQGGGIGRAEWRINGVTVGVVEKPAPVAAGKPVALKQAMALDPGENTVELVAYNGANLVASAPARAKVTWTGTEPSVPPRLYLLAVGINDYLDERRAGRPRARRPRPDRHNTCAGQIRTALDRSSRSAAGDPP
jgi:WD40 repeat protein